MNESLDARVRRVLGLPGVLGVGLLAAALAFGLGGLLPIERELQALRDDVRRIEAGLTRGAASREPAASDPAELLAGFYRYFPASQDLPGAVRAIHERAAAEGLVLDTGEYRLMREPSLRMLRYQVTLPVKGPYPKVRRFIERALFEVPGLSLDDVSLRREAIGEAAVEARVQFSLFLGQP